MGLLTIRRIDTDASLNPIGLRGQLLNPSGCIDTLALTEPTNYNPGQSISVNAPFAGSCAYSNQSLAWFLILDSKAGQNNNQSGDAIGSGSFDPVLEPRTSTGSAFVVDGLTPTYIQYDGSIRAFSPEVEVEDYLKTHVLTWESSAQSGIVKTDSYRVLPSDGSADDGEEIPSYPGGFDPPNVEFSARLSPDPPYLPAGSLALITTGANSESYSWFQTLDTSASENNLQSPDAVGSGTHNPALEPQTSTGSAFVVDGLTPTYIQYDGQMKIIVADSSADNNWSSTRNEYVAQFDNRNSLSTSFRKLETIQ